ncbi:hypothetical protein HK098_006149 [Nowakowskiella sp. JEL0407]|nr:hypothetical protein HK098_006149 [Nowakowskiella sp. JEL0407]
MSFTKKIGQFRQWTGEKIGNAQRTETSDDFKELENDTNLRNEQTQNVYDACCAYLKGLGKRGDSEKAKKSPLEAMGSAMVMYGNQLPEDSVYGNTLIKVGECHERLGQNQSEYVADISSGYVNRLSLILYDMKEFYSLKKKMDNRRLDFDAKQNRAQKSKKESMDLYEDVNTAKIKYEESLSDVTQRMVRLNDNEDEQLQDLLDFVDIETAHAEKTLKALQKLQATLEGIPRGKSVGPRSMKKSKSQTGSFQEDYARKSSVRSDEPPAMPLREPLDDQTEKKSSHSGAMLHPAQSFNVNNSPPRTSSNKCEYSTLKYRTKLSNTVAKASSSQNYLKQVKVTFDFDAEGPEELTIRRGDMVNVTTEIDAGWWEGEMADGSGRSGMFPSNYCEQVFLVIPKAGPKMPARPSIQSDSQHEYAPKSLGSRSNSVNFNDENTFVESAKTASTEPKPINNSLGLGPSPASRLSGTNPPRSISTPVQSSAPHVQQLTSMTAPGTPKRTENIKCSTCDCTSFVPHAFKPHQCAECYHSH